jgi:hypothetical protein
MRVGEARPRLAENAWLSEWRNVGRTSTKTSAALGCVIQRFRPIRQGCALPAPQCPVALYQQLEALRQVFELDSEEAEVIAEEVELSTAMEQLPSREQLASIRPRSYPSSNKRIGSRLVRAR